jgi:hypothetical protein
MEVAPPRQPNAGIVAFWVPFHRHVFRTFGFALTVAFFALVSLAARASTPALAVGPDPHYAPRLVAPVFNVKDYGARGDDTGDDTDAIRSALAACQLAGGGTVYLPAGTYRVAPKEEGAYTFYLHFGNLTIEGDGAHRTTLNFRAWGMKDPAGPILKRGGGFTTHLSTQPIDGISLRGFRATGNAPPTRDAGKWWGDDSLTGWDITHKGLGIWGWVTNLVVEDCEWDNWRGEVLYSGGGLELGKFTIRRTGVHDSNASAISMGGDVLVENCDIYRVYNGTECMSMGGQQKLVVRQCVIEINRGFPADMRIGTFGIVYLGFRGSSLLVEDCKIGDANESAIFLSEFAHNVIIRNNIFEDTVAIWMIFLNMYSGHHSVPTSEWGWENFKITGNKFYAKNRDIEGVFLSPSSPGQNWQISNNEVRAFNGKKIKTFIGTRGAHGTYRIENNTIANAEPMVDYEGPRPQWFNNNVSGYHADGTRITDSRPADDTPLVFRPIWSKANIVFVNNYLMTRRLIVEPNLLRDLPVDFRLEFRRTAESDLLKGVEIRPDATWNTLERGYMLYRGAVLNLRKGPSGRLEFESYIAPETNFRKLTQTEPQIVGRAIDDLSFFGQQEVILAPNVRHIFRSHSGVAIGDTVTLRHNALTTIAHVPGVVETFNGEDFVATESGTLLATRVGEVLKILDPTPHAWMESQGLPGGTPWTADPDGDGQSLLLEYALGGHPQASDPRLVIPRRKNGVMQLSFLWNQAAADLRYDVEASSDLRTWSPILSSNRGGPWTGPARFMLDEGSTGLTWMTVTDVTGASEEDARFMRIRVEEP